MELEKLVDKVIEERNKKERETEEEATLDARRMRIANLCSFNEKASELLLKLTYCWR
jgi:hypothetical protein